jgi:hypothetical protein
MKISSKIMNLNEILVNFGVLNYHKLVLDKIQISPLFH